MNGQDEAPSHAVSNASNGYNGSNGHNGHSPEPVQIAGTNGHDAVLQPNGTNGHSGSNGHNNTNGHNDTNGVTVHAADTIAEPAKPRKTRRVQKSETPT